MHMHRALRVLFAGILVLSLTACSGSPGEPADAAATSKRTKLAAAFAELDRQKAPAIVAVSLKGEDLAIKEFGALRDDGVSAERTMVDIGSITKTVTAVAVSKLVEQTRVRLDETLAEVFPVVPADKASVTVKQLLTHTAGLTESVGDDSEVIAREAFVERALASPLIEAPGSRYAYSNVGYSLLAAIIEVRSGRSYEEYLREDVLAPAGVGEIGYLASYDAGRGLRSASGESILDASWGGHDASWHLIGNGGLVTTAKTFVEFLHAFTSGEIIGLDSLELLQHPHVAEEVGGESFYGYGLVVQDVPQLGRIYWHDGGNDVFSAEWSIYADHGDVMFVAGRESSAGESTASEVAGVVRAHLYGAD
jgi:CubicO group peptidase (beta-lactamase class C family)